MILQNDGKILITGYKNKGYDYFFTARFLNTQQILREEPPIEPNAISATNLIVYPNPVYSNHLSVQLNMPNNEEAEITIYNLSGQQMMPTISMNFPDGYSNQEITISDELKNGLYILMIRLESKKVFTKFEIFR